MARDKRSVRDQRNGHPNRQDLLGHAVIATTMICTHLLKIGGGGVRSPMDSLGARSLA